MPSRFESRRGFLRAVGLFFTGLCGAFISSADCGEAPLPAFPEGPLNRREWDSITTYTWHGQPLRTVSGGDHPVITTYVYEWRPEDKS